MAPPHPAQEPAVVLAAYRQAEGATVRPAGWWPLGDSWRLRGPEGSFLLLLLPDDMPGVLARAERHRLLHEVGVPAPLFCATRDEQAGVPRTDDSTWVLIEAPEGLHSGPQARQVAAAGRLLARAHTCLDVLVDLKGRSALPAKPPPLIPPMLGRVRSFLEQLGPDGRVLRQKIAEIREAARLAAESRPDGPTLGGLSPSSLLVDPLGDAKGLRWVEPGWGPQWLEVALCCYEFSSQYRWAASPELVESFLLAYAIERYGPELSGFDACQAAVSPVGLPLALFAAGIVSKLREVAAGVAPDAAVVADEIGHLPEVVQQVVEVLRLPSALEVAGDADGGTPAVEVPAS